MKAVIIVLALALIFGNLVCNAANEPLFSSLIRAQSNLLDLFSTPSRVKRQDFELIHSPKCTIACSVPVRQEIKGINPSSSSLNPEIFFDIERFNRFCGVVEEAKKCQSACPSSDTRFLMGLLLKVFHRFCVDKRTEFESYIPCYSKSSDNVTDICAPRCGGEEKIDQLRFEMRVAATFRRRDISALYNALGSICELVSCQKSCETEVMTLVCGSEKPGKLLEGFGTRQYRQMEQKFQAAGISDYWPKQCSDMVDNFPIDD